MDMKSTIASLEAAFREQSENRVLMPARQVMKEANSDAVVRIMAASASGIRALGLKALLGVPGKRNPDSTYFLTLVLDTSDASILAIIAANRLTQLRTGAASGIATKYLARRDSHAMGVLGAGVQGYGQLEGVATATSISKVVVYDLDAGKVEAIASQAKKKLGVDVQRAEKIEDLYKCDIICTATPASKPVIFGSPLGPGTHINAIGSNAPNRQEIDVSVLQRSRVFVDRLEQVVEEAGDLAIPIQQGLYSASNVVGNLCDVITGRLAGRADDSQITLFKSVGIALEDIAVARRAYELAIEKGMGQMMAL
jgi:ornithine cyclodeaminase/alanine dehydrogenase-like protein (mu-crystallin family)